MIQPKYTFEQYFDSNEHKSISHRLKDIARVEYMSFSDARDGFCLTRNSRLEIIFTIQRFSLNQFSLFVQGDIVGIKNIETHIESMNAILELILPHRLWTLEIRPRSHPAVSTMYIRTMRDELLPIHPAGRSLYNFIVLSQGAYGNNTTHHPKRRKPLRPVQDISPLFAASNLSTQLVSDVEVARWSAGGGGR